MELKTSIKKLILESNAKHHDFWAETHDSNVPYIHRKITKNYYWDLIESNIELEGKVVKNSDVLEIGCGTGTFTDLFILNGAKSFTGIDLSIKMIEKAKIKAKSKNYRVPVDFYVDSLENFALTNKNKFDIIQSSSFIHHLSDIDDGIRCINSMLKHGGIYIAIHEEINDFTKTRVHKLDEQLQYLFGYGGSNNVSKSTRIKQTILFFIRPIKSRIKKILFGTSEENTIPKTSPPYLKNVEIEKQIDYVDFQLNEKFSLSSKCAIYGKIKPYCYFGFPELMIFGKPLNFELLIMKNHQ